MTKLDLKKAEHELYSAPKDHAVVVDVPIERYLMLDGHGSPNEGHAFQDAIGALYAVAYMLKFDQKKAHPERDYAVMPLEALWWWDGEGPFAQAAEKEWHWTLMIRQPDFVTQHDVERAIVEAKEKNPRAVDVRFERYHEGRAMQQMHVGPYKEELRTIQHLHEEIREAGLVMSGKHHEIYLGDPRRAKPERLRTIVRQPVREPAEASA